MILNIVKLNSCEIQWISLDWVINCFNWLKIIQFRSWHWISWFSATPHTSQEPWPWNCESSKEVSKGYPKTLPKSCSVITCPQRVVWNHMWPSPRLNAISRNFYSCRVLTHDRIYQSNNCEISECRGLRFCVRPTSKRWFLKTIQVTMKQDPFDTM